MAANVQSSKHDRCKYLIVVSDEQSLSVVELAVENTERSVC